ncbi:MAG: hypothetical protein ACLVHV_17220 [Oscillospiraceae bacterium]
MARHAVCHSFRHAGLFTGNTVLAEVEPNCGIGVFSGDLFAVRLAIGLLQGFFPVLFCHLHGQCRTGCAVLAGCLVYNLEKFNQIADFGGAVDFYGGVGQALFWFSGRRPLAKLRISRRSDMSYVTL